MHDPARPASPEGAESDLNSSTSPCAKQNIIISSTSGSASRQYSLGNPPCKQFRRMQLPHGENMSHLPLQTWPTRAEIDIMMSMLPPKYRNIYTLMGAASLSSAVLVETRGRRRSTAGYAIVDRGILRYLHDQIRIQSIIHRSFINTIIEYIMHTNTPRDVLRPIYKTSAMSDESPEFTPFRSEAVSSIGLSDQITHHITTRRPDWNWVLSFIAGFGCSGGGVIRMSVYIRVCG